MQENRKYSVLETLAGHFQVEDTGVIHGVQVDQLALHHKGVTEEKFVLAVYVEGYVGAELHWGK